MNDFIIKNGVLEKYVGSGGCAEIPDGVKHIGEGAFELSKIDEVVIPPSVKIIEKWAFLGCYELKKVYYGSSPDDWADIRFENASANPIYYSNSIYFCGEILREISFGSVVRTIGDFSFINCRTLKQVTFSDCLVSIGDFAFSHTGLKSVTLPVSVKRVGVSVFSGIKEINVFDTIDDDAIPAADFTDSEKGRYNSKIVSAGLFHGNDSKYELPSASQAEMRDFKINVYSSADGRIKFSVFMDSRWNKKTYYTAASSWGRHADFNFKASDENFANMSEEAKLDYALNRIRYPVELDSEKFRRFSDYLASVGEKVSKYFIDYDNVTELSFFEPCGIISSLYIDRLIDYTVEKNAINCRVWLLEWGKGKSTDDCGAINEYFSLD